MYLSTEVIERGLMMLIVGGFALGVVRIFFNVARNNILTRVWVDEAISLFLVSNLDDHKVRDTRPVSSYISSIRLYTIHRSLGMVPAILGIGYQTNQGHVVASLP